MMRLLAKTIGAIFLTVMFCTGLSTLAMAEHYPGHQPGKAIKGVVTKVDEKSSESWNVSVQEQETGETVNLHVDNTTTRLGMMSKPKVGDSVDAKYDTHNNHAQSFLTNQQRSH
jgi:hypothetical protein